MMRFVVFGFCFCAHSALFADCINAYSCRVPREIARFKREVPRVRMLFPGAPCRPSQTVEARARAIDAMADTAIVARLDAPVASSPRAAPSREHERNADALFESRSVVEVREVVMRTEREARDKEEELRQLVGSSYRDAIASADTFAEMESNAKRVVSLLTDVRDTLRRLPRIVAEAEALASGPAPRLAVDAATSATASADSTSADSTIADSDALYAAGSRVKFLVDTPEKIWGSLEERDHVGAARRFLAARDVLEALESREVDLTSLPSDSDSFASSLPRAELLRAFPLLRQQAPILDSFRAQIARRARAALESSAAGFAADANALAAVVLVEGASLADALRLLLQTRRARVRAGLRRAAALGGGSRRAASALAGAAREARRVAVAVVACFLHAGAASNEKALVAAALDESGTDAGMAFQGVANAAEETRRRDARLDRRAASLVPVTSEEASRAFREWIDGVARDVADAASRGGLLRGVCSLAALAETERRVVDRIARDDDAEPGGDDACVALLGKPLDAWFALAEAPHVDRARELMREALRLAPLRDATDAALAAANSKHSRDARARGGDARAWGGDARGAVPGYEDAPATARAAASLADALASTAAAARRDALTFAGAGANARRGARPAAAAAAAAAARQDRLARLEPFAHAECHAGVMSYASFLAERLAAVESIPTTASFSATATERALLLAMTAHAAASRHEQLAALMGPSSEWSAADEISTASRGARAFRLRRGAGAAGSVAGSAERPNGKLGEALAALRAAAERGFRVWAEAHASRAGDALAAALASDETLASEETPRDWEEERVGDGAGDDGLDVTIRLPALPSPRALAVIHDASLEALRCGGHVLPPVALHALGAATARRCAEAYAAFVDAAPLRSRVSEKGALRLLFDLRLATDALAGRGAGAKRSASATRVEGAATWAVDAAAEAATLVERVSRTLSDELDPIDWATYESRLWANAARAYGRGATLHGLFAQLHGIHRGENPREGVGGNAGVPATLPPRFSYLPVSAPATRRAGAAEGATKGAVDWTAAGWDRFGEVGSAGGYDEDGGNFLGKLGQGLGLGKGSMAWAL